MDSVTYLEGLNKDQRRAVTDEGKRILVLAGAGSGKTTTIYHRIAYLINEKKVHPSSILAVTFTKNACNEIIDRLILSTESNENYKTILSDKTLSENQRKTERKKYSQKYSWIANLNISTIHSFCFQLLRERGVHIFDNQFRIIEQGRSKSEDNDKTAVENTLDVLDKIIREHSVENNDYLITLKKYILDFFVDKIEEKGMGKSEYPGKDYTSLNGTKVRSKSEQYIANWLYVHNIEFSYERVVALKSFGMAPDFYIPEGNFYIEHVSDLSYPTKDKEEEFRKTKKLLFKTYENDVKDTGKFNLILDNIVRGKVSSYNSAGSLLSFDSEFNFYHQELADFISMLIKAIDMMKIENISIKKQVNKAQKDQHERVRTFYNLALPIILKYELYCINKSYLDYNDLIIKTCDLINNDEKIAQEQRSKYEYILIDEFQDINNLQFEMLNLLLTNKTQLYCVGDDWQSIYGYSGANSNLIMNFKTYFDKAKIIKLELNYRSESFIVEAGNELIKNNENRIEKRVRPVKFSDGKIEVFTGNSESENIEFLIDNVRRLNEAGYNKDDILILYRRHQVFNTFSERIEEEHVFATGRTIHSAKGLQAKIVFIIGLTTGTGGFPDVRLDDRIFQIIKETKIELLLEEERRLFYVAISRAKERLILITEKSNESVFLKEIPERLILHSENLLRPMIDKIELCPNCDAQVHSYDNYCPACGKGLKN